MSELELLDQLQTIKKKLDNNIELTDHEYEIYTDIMAGVILGVVKWSFDLVSKIMEGDKNEKR